MGIKQSMLALQLSADQSRALHTLHQVLGKNLEKSRTLDPEWMTELTLQMKAVLQEQPGFPALAKSARDVQQVVHLTHPDPAILNLPWRLAVADLPLLFLTKGKPAAADLPLLEAEAPPLKILVMISSPEDADFESRLSYEEEEEEIIRSFSPLFDLGQVQIDFTDDGSPESLADKLADNHYHIVHFSGHGISRSGKGYLALENHLVMDQQLVEAAEFARIFQEKPEHMPGLVVLSSCQTAKGGLEEGMQSVADELLLKRVPAVIAMSVSITDYFATYFASMLYQRLAEKEPLYRAFQHALHKTRAHEASSRPALNPSQWMIPQLLTSRKVDHLIDWDRAEDQIHYAASKFVIGQAGLIRERRDGYRFVGRRRDRRRIFPLLAAGRSVLLQGQGGVGKTAMAEYIVQRLVARDQRIRPFVFNEINAKLPDMIREMEVALREQGKRKSVLEIEKDYGQDAFRHFQRLLAEVEDGCRPLFIFDNLESFQEKPGEAFAAEYAESLTRQLHFLYEEKVPLILTCRYPVPECPGIPTVDLNQVAVNDFLKKSLQLSLRRLPRQIRTANLANLLDQRLTFREVIEWLHETFGGNYRALEFFDDLFAHRQDRLPDALRTLADFKATYAGAGLETRQEMSKDLLFAKLLELLDESEIFTLRLLRHFRIPVLVTALQMQRHEPDYPIILDALQQLTLVEKHTDPRRPSLQYYYVTPLIRELIREVQGEEVPFSAEMAGRYHRWMDTEINRENYNDLAEAMAFLYAAKNARALNEMAAPLVDHYYGTAQYQEAWQAGIKVYELNGDNTRWSILNKIGLVLLIFGQGTGALKFLKAALKAAKSEENIKNQGVTLNNISQIYAARGDYETALKYLEESLQIRRQIGDKSGEGVTLNNISQIYAARGDYETALKYLEESLQISRQIGDKSGEGVTLNNISQIYDARGDYETALKYLEESLQIRVKSEIRVEKA